MADRQPEDEDQFKVWLEKHIDRSLNDEGGDVSALRQYNFDRYYGKAYGNEREGHSSFNTREVFEAIEWARPSIMRVFMSNDRAVEFRAEGFDDEQNARDETELVNHEFYTNCNGYQVTSEVAFDVLMNPNAYVAVDIQERTEIEHHTLSGLLAPDLAVVDASPDIDILSQESSETVVEGQVVEMFTIDIRARRKKRDPVIEVVAPDEMLIDSQHTELSIEDVGFAARRQKLSQSDLVAMGIDEDELEGLAVTDDHEFDSERTSRLFYSEENPDGNEDEGSDDGPERTFWVHDITCLYDYDGDGYAERRRVLMVGHKILENEADSHNPFIACASIIIPHKHICMSFAESVTDLQLLMTTLMRQMLDNVYAQNESRHFMNTFAMCDDNETLDAFLDRKSAVIPIKGAPRQEVSAEEIKPVIQELLAVITFMQEKPQMRTGVAPQLALDPSTLKESTMGAFVGALEEAAQRQELLVRNLAETLFVPMFRKLHGVMRRHINRPLERKIRGEWRQFNPAQWRPRQAMDVKVGLGHNSRTQKLVLFEKLLQYQLQAMNFNLSSYEKIFTTFDRVIETADMGDAESFFNDPSKPVEQTDPQTGQTQLVPWQPPQPQPDPQSIVAQAQAQALMAEQQRKFKEAAAQHQREMMKIQLDGARVQIQRDQLMLTRDEFVAKYEVDSAEALARIEKLYADADLSAAKAAELGGLP